ncbi:MAG: hypothetical protein ACREEW_00370 [Caulobacteraceae bacterium]
MEPPSIHASLAEARDLSAAGQDEAATSAYLALLSRAPNHLEALMEIAALAMRGGHRTAAMTAYRQAAISHPADTASRINLGGLLLDAGVADAAREAFAEAVALAPALPAARQGLARALMALGETDAGRALWADAFSDGWLAPQPYRGPPGQGVRVLLLVASEGGNMPTAALLDDRLFAVTAAYADFAGHAQELPAHDVIFNAIGDADLCGAALEGARRIVAMSPAPVVNAPERVAQTGRAANAARMAAIPGLIAPAMRQLPRQALLADRALAFPLLLRSPGYNTGQHFVRVERRDDLEAAAADLPGGALIAIEPLEARGRDGLWRKYRAMFVGGAILPLHLAVSRHWKTHYFTADMAACAARRREEAAFLDDMAGTIGSRAMAALGGVEATLGLDYAGVDFGLDAEGRLLFFEANPGMAVLAPGPEPMWDYRRAPAARVVEAARALVIGRALAG